MSCYSKEKLKESQTVEFKKSIGQLSRAMETLCAFANTDLGSVYFGINDDGKTMGIEMNDSSFRKVQETVFNTFDPKIYPNIFEEEIDGKQVLVVELKNAPDRPYFVKGKAYKRVGTSNTTLSKVEMERMMYERGNPDFHYDRSSIESEMGDMNHERIRWFYRRAHEERNLPLDDIPETKDKLNILTDGKPNVAGILAFGHDILKYFPTSFTRCAVFEGLDKTGRMLDHLDIKTDLFSQIDQAENFVLRNIRKEAQVSNETGRRESRYEVPYRAIREAIANAVAHRDYRISSTVDVAIFDDRIEIWSPGDLPQGMTLEQLNKPHKSVLRNGTVAELLYLVRYIEKWGMGIKNMKDWMMLNGLPEPKYEMMGSNLVTTLIRQATQARRQQVGTMSVPSWDQVGTKLGLSWDQVKNVLSLCSEPVKLTIIIERFGWKHRTKFRDKFVNPLIESELLTMTIPDKPRSKSQEYVITGKGRYLLKELEDKI